MNALVVIAILALSLFGPGWSSEHKAFWEWQLGRKLEGYEEHRLARGCHPDGDTLIIPDGTISKKEYCEWQDGKEYCTLPLPSPTIIELLQRH